jgi:hypothetical protein
MKVSLPRLQGNETPPDSLSTTLKNFLPRVLLSRTISLFPPLISRPGRLVQRMLRFRTVIVSVFQSFRFPLTPPLTLWFNLFSSFQNRYRY